MGSAAEAKDRSVPAGQEAQAGPTTEFGILENLERFVSGRHSLSELREEFTRVGSLLLVASQMDLAWVKRRAEIQGKEWSGHIEGYNCREQDGSYSHEVDWVDIGKRTLRSGFKHTFLAGEVTETEIEEAVMSGDGNSLKSVSWKRWKDFGKDGQNGEVLLWRVAVKLKENIVRSASIERNIDTSPRPDFYYRPINSIVKHEVRLEEPPKSA